MGKVIHQVRDLDIAFFFFFFGSGRRLPKFIGPRQIWQGDETGFFTSDCPATNYNKDP